MITSMLNHSSPIRQNHGKARSGRSLTRFDACTLQSQGAITWFCFALLCLRGMDFYCWFDKRVTFNTGVQPLLRVLVRCDGIWSLIFKLFAGRRTSQVACFCPPGFSFSYMWSNCKTKSIIRNTSLFLISVNGDRNVINYPQKHKEQVFLMLMDFQ